MERKLIHACACNIGNELLDKLDIVIENLIREKNKLEEEGWKDLYIDSIYPDDYCIYGYRLETEIEYERRLIKEEREFNKRKEKEKKEKELFLRLKEKYEKGI